MVNGPGRSVAISTAAKMNSVRDVAGPAHVFAETSAREVCESTRGGLEQLLAPLRALTE